MLSGLLKFWNSNDKIRRSGEWLEFATFVVRNRCLVTKSLEYVHISVDDQNVNSYQTCNGSVSRRNLVIGAFAFAQGVFGLGRLSRSFRAYNRLHCENKVTIYFAC